MLSWICKLLKGEPHRAIGGSEDEEPYLLRWYLLPRNGFCNLYLHKFLRDDRDEALHDHPWWFLSFMISGEYEEITETGVNTRKAPALCYRPATWKHRIVLKKDSTGKPVPCWTIIFTGSVKREWGFFCPKGFIPFKEFQENNDGKGGCD